MKALPALPTMVSGRPDRYLVALPSLEINDQTDLIRLERLGIFSVNLNEKDPFTIDLSPALKKPAEKPVQITLTPEEEKEFDRHQFKSRLPIEITGEVKRRKSNLIYVGGAEVLLGDAPFCIFLHLVAELSKGGDGSVYKGDPEYKGGLIGDCNINPDGMDQAIQRLRELFVPALRGLDAKSFIEANKPKHIRLSTHPAFISYNKDKLLHHEEERIRKWTRQLP